MTLTNDNNNGLTFVCVMASEKVVTTHYNIITQKLDLSRVIL